MDKPILEYVVEWGDSKERTWSGTPFSLMQALKEHYTINEFNASPKYTLFSRIWRKLFRISYDFGIRQHRKFGRKIKRILYKNQNVNILQFAEIAKNDRNINTYIYIDLSVSYMKDLLESNPYLYKLSSFDFVGSKYIYKREPIQSEYLNNCSGIFTMSHWLRDYLINVQGINRDKIHCVGGGVNLDISKVEYSHKENNKILFVGRDYLRKGLPLVMDAFSNLKNRYPTIELHVAGPSENPFRDDFEGYFFYGDCSHDRLSELFNLCDVFCMPSYFEAYGLVFIEALCYGLPCIGRNEYEMPYLIEDNVTGKLLQGNSVHELTEAISEVLDSDRYRKAVIARKEEYLNKYSWNTVAQRISDIIGS